MFNTNLMIRADDRTLEQAPNAFDAVSVNVANNPFLNRVVHRPMLRVGTFNSYIGRKLIGIDRFRVRGGVIADKLLQNVFSRVRDNLQPNHTATLYGSNGDCLSRFVAATMPANMTADIGF